MKYIGKRDIVAGGASAGGALRDPGAMIVDAGVVHNSVGACTLFEKDTVPAVVVAKVVVGNTFRRASIKIQAVSLKATSNWSSDCQYYTFQLPGSCKTSGTEWSDLVVVEMAVPNNKLHRLCPVNGQHAYLVK